ncbi:molecular chaperone [Oleomonas cavernae]|uniref:Molecular chaperone n=1 Tax=Oleomonas cavernae TaxID=2320859 RepID=A0A418WDM5_9PROT|nr:molecular chaperone [Oleomonas cavernae]RJF88088.1 molecular chaperone [Oleomonas cavernae]
MSRLWRLPLVQWLAALVLCGAAFASHPASASSIQVSPVRVELSGDQPVMAIYVTNNGPAALLVQASVMSWAQAAGEDEYAATRDVLVNPPQFRLEPGQQQLVRFGLANRQILGPNEGSYRAFLQEVPETPPQGATALQTVLRISVPVFIAPNGGARPGGAWAAAKQGGSVVLRFQNTGNIHLQLGKMRVVDGERTLATIEVGGYVLPGQTRDWPLAGVGSLPAGAKIAAESDQGGVEQVIGGH